MKKWIRRKTQDYFFVFRSQKENKNETDLRINFLELFRHISEDLSFFYILVMCQNRDALTIIDFNVPKSRFKMSEKILVTDDRIY